MSRILTTFALAGALTASTVSIAAADVDHVGGVTVLPRSDAPSERVSYRGVNFRDPVQVQVFYNRLQSVARRACSDETLRWPSALFGCTDVAVYNAVQQADRPQLTALADRRGLTERVATGY